MGRAPAWRRTQGRLTFGDGSTAGDTRSMEGGPSLVTPAPSRAAPIGRRRIRLVPNDSVKSGAECGGTIASKGQVWVGAADAA